MIRRDFICSQVVFFWIENIFKGILSHEMIKTVIFGQIFHQNGPGEPPVSFSWILKIIGYDQEGPNMLLNGVIIGEKF